MPPAPLPPDESDRLKAVRGLGLLDTPPEERFDALTRQAQRLLGVPIALIGLVDQDRQWFKSRAGLKISQLPRDSSFSAHVILSDAPLIVFDASRDPRFSDNPLVVGEPKIRFYAGVPLSSPDGHKVGTFSVVDRIARQFSDAQVRILLELARQAERVLATGPALSASDDAGAARALVELRRSPRRRAERRRTIAGFALAALTIAAATTLSLKAVERLLEDAEYVEHTHEVLENLDAVFGGAQDAYTAARGYALTGDDGFLQAYETGRASALTGIERVRWLATDSSVQLSAVDDLRRAVAERIAASEEMIRARRERGPAATFSLGRADRAPLENVRRLVERMRLRELALLASRQERARAGARSVAYAVVAAGILALVMLALVLVALNRDLDDRLAGQAAAETLTARLTAILDSMEHGVVVVDAVGRRLLHNPAAERILGTGLLRVEPMRWGQVARFLEPDGIAPLPDDQRPIVRAIRGEIGRVSEFLMRYPDKPEGLALSAASAPVRALDGEIIGGVVVFQDVSERRRAERRRALQLEVAGALAQAGPDDPVPVLLERICRGLGWGVAEYWAPDQRTATLRLTDSWHKADNAVDEFVGVGAAQAFVPGQGLAGRAWADGAPIWLPDAAADLSSRRSAEAEHAGLHGALAFPVASGDRRFGVIAAYSWSAERPDEDLMGLAASLGAQIGLFLDRRSAQADAARSAAERQAVFDAATEVAIVSTDVDGTIRIFNAGAERMLGYSAAELSNKATVAILFTREEIAARRRELIKSGVQRPARALLFAGEALLSGGTDSREWTLQRKDGSQLPAQVIFTVIRAPGGEAVGFLGIATDITDRRRAAEEMARARDLAVRAAQLKSEFLANMSHEIRTPMNAIIGMTGLLLETELDERQREYAVTARNAGDALLELISDILDFSKIEAGKLAIESIPFDLRDVVDGAAQLVAERARAKGLALAVSVPPGLATGLRGDPSRLRQVLLNLLGNAVKFTASGRIEVAVSPRPDPGGRTRLRVSVKDTGIGIPAEAQKILFQPFTQADASTTRRFGGTGLGLAISKQLVELMGGEIGVESAEGRGSTFWFDISFEPAPDAARRAQPAPRPDVPAAAPAKPSRILVRRRFRVLVVDDNEVNRRLVALQLEKLGYACEGLPSAAALLARLESGPAHLVLLDCQMPGMDGYEAAREIRRREAGGARRTPIVAMTAHALAGDREKCLAAGMDDYLPKPVRLESLSQSLALRDPALNAAIVRELRETAGAQFAEMRDIFLHHAAESVREIGAAFSRGDSAQARAVAHGLRGSAASFGAAALSALAEMVEIGVEDGHAEDARLAAEELPGELGRATRALEAL